MSFIGDDFLLSNDISKSLYHQYAKKLPIIDYHCHLDTKEIAENCRITDIGELFLKHDHYKWRIMRSNGVDEAYITGDKAYYDKFKKFAQCLPYCIGNPILHWTQLELERYFGIGEFLCDDNSDTIWHKAQSYLSENELYPQEIIKKSNVEVICTTDDPADDLTYHKKIAKSSFDVKVLPTFRPDKVFNIENESFAQYMKDNDIYSFKGLVGWVIERIRYFDLNGCKLSDHSLESIPASKGVPAQVVFEKGINGNAISKEEADSYKYYMMHLCAESYSEFGWTMQLHIGALRNNNTAKFNMIGADSGFDSINDMNIAEDLSRLLDSLEMKNILPKTIIYNLNPKDNYVVGTMIGNFQSNSTPSKIQFGSAWWFNDQKDGIESHIAALASLGVLGRFVGMLTDSRSLLSYTRHEYFRRILCNLIGKWVVEGLYPKDENMLKTLIEGICYNNAKNYFDF